MKKVNIYPRVNNGEYRTVPVGEPVGWIVDEGKVNGKQKRRTFKTESEAKEYGYKIDVAREAKQINAVHDLGELMSLRPELMYCWERLKSVGANFRTAVDYYIKHYRSSKGNITVGEAMVMFRKAKVDEECSESYLESLDRQHWPRFLRDFPTTHVMNTITAEELRNHCYHKRWIEWSTVTRITYIKNIRALFSFLVKREYLIENPALKIDLPKAKPLDIGFLTIGSVYSLLNKGIELGWHGRVAANVLVLFCGIRVEEVSKMKWMAITGLWSDVENPEAEAKVEVSGDIAKMGQRRINVIPPNAIEWLRLVVPRGIKKIRPIIEGGWEDKMSVLRKKAEIKYPKNAARHSFGTYHVAAYNNPQLTALMMGHIRGVATLVTHYRNVVDKEMGIRYFNITPNNETLELLKKSPKRVWDNDRKKANEVFQQKVKAFERFLKSQTKKK